MPLPRLRRACDAAWTGLLLWCASQTACRAVPMAAPPVARPVALVAA